MNENNKIRWLSGNEVMALHELSIARFGGTHGIRDKNLLESAISRPQNMAIYDSASIFELAACYAHGIVKNHPFVDGNKRTSISAAGVFLELNGYILETNSAEMIVAVMHLAASKMQAEQFAMWLEDNCKEKG